MAAFDLPITLKVMASPLRFCPAGKFQAEENAMGIERAKKLLKRVWKLLFGLKWWLRQACYYSFFRIVFPMTSSSQISIARLAMQPLASRDSSTVSVLNPRDNC
jgi:hypothetical protein